MNFSAKLMIATIIAFLGVAWSWIFRSRSVQSHKRERIEIGRAQDGRR